MAKQLTWDNAEDIGILLSEAHPELDPLAVRFTDLHRYVTELPDFAGDPKASNEGKLEAIQMAWHEEVQDDTQNLSRNRLIHSERDLSTLGGRSTLLADSQNFYNFVTTA